jgi:tellurite resistance protein
MCCEVARADGVVSAGEYERLIEILAELGAGAVSFGELQLWLEQGAPSPRRKLPEELIRLFLHEAISIARADGQVDQVELASIKDFVRYCFEGGQR